MNKGMTIKVLDHGYVRLIDSMGSDEAIVEAARMSTGKGFVDWDAVKECSRCGLRFPEYQPVFGYACAAGHGDDHDWKKLPGDSKLLEFMYKNKHSTPFEFGELHIEVQAPLMVFREWHRHRTQSYSEFSARYSQMPDLHYLPAVERIQKQSKTNRQGSSEALHSDDAAGILASLEQEQRNIYEYYDWLVKEKGVAKEVARLNTPVSRYSKMRAKTDLWNWLAFLRLRMATTAQWEIRQYANAVAEMVKSIWPRTYALFEEHDLYGVRLSRSEAQALVNGLRKVTLGELSIGVESRAVFERLEKIGVGK